MQHQASTDPSQIDRSSQDLAADALHEAKKLLAAELALAKRDLRRSAAALSRSAVAFGVAGVAGLAGIDALMVSLAVGQRRNHPARSTAVGLGLLALAAAAWLVGRSALPRGPLPIAARIASDIEDVAQRVVG
ncbi:phage holin family protein [Sorangium sp. So ce590]|uniref:phage holin family protein n=1 Tax=unclassified Sorangium TaxID=2621164 RepID=UPI003F63B45E